MGFNVGGIQVPGIIASSIQTGKGMAEQVVQGQINEVKSNPAKFLKELQQPSGMSSFLDIKI